jgi:hypothetical protein
MNKCPHKPIGIGKVPCIDEVATFSEIKQGFDSTNQPNMVKKWELFDSS